MNCHFCQTSLQAQEPGNKLMAKRFIHFVCLPCQTTYVYNRLHGYRGYYMEPKGYRAYFFPFTKQFRLCLSNGEILMGLDHVPDINPSNIHHRIKQLLKLKVFS